MAKKRRSGTTGYIGSRASTMDRGDLYVGAAALGVLGLVAFVAVSGPKVPTASPNGATPTNMQVPGEVPGEAPGAAGLMEAPAAPATTTAAAAAPAAADSQAPAPGSEFKLGRAAAAPAVAVETAVAQELDAAGQKARVQMGAEHAVAEDLDEAARKARAKIGRAQESAVADELDEAADRAKKKLAAERMDLATPAAEADLPPAGDAGHPASTTDPFDQFVDPVAARQTAPNIDYSGFGHSGARGRAVPRRDPAAAPRFAETFVYKRVVPPDWLGPPGGYDYRSNVRRNASVQCDRYFAYRAPPVPATPARAPGVVTEREIANDMGVTDHSFESDNNLQSGLGQDQPVRGPQEQREASKPGLRASVERILALFDRLFNEELFPDAVVDAGAEPGTFSVRAAKGGKCLHMPRYYEYVEKSVLATLGLGSPEPLSWAQNVALDFEAVDRNKTPLRAALQAACEETEPLQLGPGGEISVAGQPVQVSVPWPSDGTVLATHPMTKRP